MKHPIYLLLLLLSLIIMLPMFIVGFLFGCARMGFVAGADYQSTWKEEWES